MIKLKEILMERISAIVYHYTNIPSFDDIVITNKFKLGNNPIPDKYLEPYNINADKYKYYMSVARTRTPGYSKISRDAYSRPLSVRFQLDGNKINSNYKGKPFDFFGALKANAIKKNEYDEYEDRIYNTDMYIPKALSYITRVDISFDLADPSLGVRGVRNMLVNAIKNLLSSTNIPIFVYNNDADFHAQLRGIQIKDINVLKNILNQLKK